MTKTNKRFVRRLKRQAKRFEIQAAKAPSALYFDGGDITIEAEGDDALPTFHMVAYTGGKMTPRGFSTPVIVDLAGMAVPSNSVPILLAHDTSRIVGHSVEIPVTANNISASGIVSGTGEAAQEVRANSKNGFPWKASIGASVEKMIHVDEGDSVTVNNATFQGPCFVARKSTLGEISFVAIAADNNTSATVVASQDLEVFDMGFEQWVSAAGWVLADLSDAQVSTLQAAYDAENVAPVTPPVPVAVVADAPVDIAAQMRAQAADEVARTNAITRICAEHDNPTIEANGQQVDLAEHALRDGLTVEATELLALRAGRLAAPAIHSTSHSASCSLEAMQGAMVLTAGIPLDSPEFTGLQAHAMGIPEFLRRGVNDEQRQRHMEASHRFNDMSALDICAEAVRLDGRQAPQGRQALIQAAFSGSALTQIFTTSVNATLLTTYMQSQDTTQGWTREADVADFKTNDRIRMANGSDLSKLPRGQEASHYNRSDLVESYKIARYAKQFVVDEQDIIDDSMNALREAPVEMGNAAARLRPDLVYAILLANDTLGADAVALFDNSTHANVQTSAALSEANLITMIALIEKQQDNSVNLNLRSSHIIVPSDLKHTAANLIRSATLAYGADDETKVGTENTLASIEQLSLVSDARLANGVTDPSTGTAQSGSATQWYAASAMAHTIEVGYLRDSGRAPMVRSFNLSEGKWGIGWDVKMDIGAKALDFRGLARSTA